MQALRDIRRHLRDPDPMNQAHAPTAALLRGIGLRPDPSRTRHHTNRYPILSRLQNPGTSAALAAANQWRARHGPRTVRDLGYPLATTHRGIARLAVQTPKTLSDHRSSPASRTGLSPAALDRRCRRRHAMARRSSWSSRRDGVDELDILRCSIPLSGPAGASRPPLRKRGVFGIEFYGSIRARVQPAITPRNSARPRRRPTSG